MIVMYTNELFIYNDITQESHWCQTEKSRDYNRQEWWKRSRKDTLYQETEPKGRAPVAEKLPKPQQTRAVFMKIALTQAQHTESRRKAESSTRPTSEP